jgi:hypothetical protein
LRAPAENLEDSIEQVISELQTVHPEREIEVTVDLPETVTCDVDGVSQLLSNLIGNALTHGATIARLWFPRAVRMGTSFSRSPMPACPYPGDKTERLFQPFTSAEGASPNGLGLSLYIASEIAKAHEGSLAVISDKSETRFTLDALQLRLAIAAACADATRADRHLARHWREQQHPDTFSRPCLGRTQRRKRYPLRAADWNHYLKHFASLGWREDEASSGGHQSLDQTEPEAAALPV